MIDNSLIAMAMLSQIFIAMINGKDADSWQTMAVVYAEVGELNKSKDGDKMLQLQPIATLSGAFDSAAQNKLEAKVLIGGDGDIFIMRAPPKGSKVILLLTWNSEESTKKSSKASEYFIPNVDVNFFPALKGPMHPPMFEVTGLDDPKVAEVVKNLRLLRGKQHEEPPK